MSIYHLLLCFGASAPVGQFAVQRRAVFFRASSIDLSNGTETLTSKPLPMKVRPSSSFCFWAVCMHRPQSMHFPGSYIISG